MPLFYLHFEILFILYYYKSKAEDEPNKAFNNIKYYIYNIKFDFSPTRSLSLILVLDLSQPNRLWRTMETLLQAAHTQLGKACSQTPSTGKAQAPAQAQQAGRFQPAARVLPKDYPVRTDPFIHYDRCMHNIIFIV